MKVTIEHEGKTWEGELTIKGTPALKPAPIRKPNTIRVPEITYKDVDITYVDVDDDGESKEKPKWQIANTHLQREFLKATHSRYFQPRVKQRLKGIESALVAGQGLGEGVYQACYDQWKDVADEGAADALGKRILPVTWWEMRLKHATNNRWSQRGTIDALLNIEKLLQHCMYNMPSETEEEEGPEPIPAWLVNMGVRE